MKNFWKHTFNITACVIVITMSICAFPTIAAASNVLFAAPIDTITAQENGTVSPYAEETTWRVRIYNGKLQKRLWSNTRGIWLTDWIDCD